MIRRRTKTLPRKDERGITMLLVAIALVSMLAMVALAIDVITLYSARSETPRAADSAALAAAKMLVDAGVTADPANTTLQGTAQTLATKVATDVATKSSIAGRQVQSADVTVTFPNGAAPSFGINPTVNVSVVNANLPTFFSRIWSRATLTVRASALAEAFNPSNSSSLIAAGVPVVARGVKPFLIPNCDPVNANNHGSNCGAGFAKFFDPTTGAITNPGVAPTGVIGEQFHLYSDCTGAGPNCGLGSPTVGMGSGGLTVYYYPAQMPTATANACPASCVGSTDFEQDIECCNPSPISCGTSATLPVVDQLAVDTSVFPDGGGGPAQDGVQCLIHQSGGTGQDTLNIGPPLPYPLEIQVGGNNPLAGSSSLSANDLVTRSDSLVTIPVYDGAATPPLPPAKVNIIGFLQVFINQAFPGGGGPKAGEFQVTVVNVLGCGSNATGAPVSSASGVPVRLIR